MNYVVAGLTVVLFVLLIWKWKVLLAYIKSANQSDRYNAIAYIVISIVSLVLLVVSSLGGADQSLIQNLILLTITSVTIALLMDRVGILNEINVKLRGSSSFRTRTEVENDYPLHQMWENAKAIKVVTMGGTAFFLGRLKDNLDKTLDNGVDFTFVNIQQGTLTWEEHFHNKMMNKTEENKNACLGVPRTITCHYKGRIHYYQTKVNIPYALMYVEKKNSKDSFVKVDLYAIDIKDGDRPCMIIRNGEAHFDFFRDQIEKIITKSDKII